MDLIYVTLQMEGISAVCWHSMAACGALRATGSPAKPGIHTLNKEINPQWIYSGSQCVWWAGQLIASIVIRGLGRGHDYRLALGTANMAGFLFHLTLKLNHFCAKLIAANLCGMVYAARVTAVVRNACPYCANNTRPHRKVYSDSTCPYSSMSSQGQQQGSLYHCTSLLFIHVIQAKATREGWTCEWKERRSLRGLHSSPTLLPSALLLPLGEANHFLTQPIPPSLFYHLSPEAPVPAPSAWVSAKEDTRQRTDRPKAAWTQSNLARDTKKEKKREAENGAPFYPRDAG
ncbi:hypothetical protein Q8A73_003717 [Channa argus]|nr:hypothetical protein Q8A73_003717 [Channa argus]